MLERFYIYVYAHIQIPIYIYIYTLEDAKTSAGTAAHRTPDDHPRCCMLR